MKPRIYQQGFVSLITTILISLLLIIVTLSMVTVEALQLRTSEDAEQSVRAYYTAEAGVEDAVAKILSDQITSDTPTSCQAGNPYYDPGGAANWTCQQVSFSGQPTGNLTADQSQTINPGPSDYQSVEVEWNQSSDPNNGDYNLNLQNGYPSASQYAADHYAAPPIELQIVEYPNGGFSQNQVCAGDPSTCGGVSNTSDAFIQNALVSPGGPNANPVVNYPTIYQSSNLTGNCGPVGRQTANPDPDGGSYNCYMELDNLPVSMDYLFRIRSRYANSDYKFVFYHCLTTCGDEVAVPSGMATIDVTAQAGDSYRRVVYDLPVGNSAASGLDYVMYSDTNVCKDFQVIDNVASPSACSGP